MRMHWPRLALISARCGGCRGRVLDACGGWRPVGDPTSSRFLRLRYAYHGMGKPTDDFYVIDSIGGKGGTRTLDPGIMARLAVFLIGNAHSHRFAQRALEFGEGHPHMIRP